MAEFPLLPALPVIRTPHELMDEDDHEDEANRPDHR